MATPTTLVRGDLAVAVEQFNLEAEEMGFIASKVLPEYDVQLPTAQYAVLLLSELLKNQDDTRAPGAGYNRQQMKFTMDNYLCQEHGVEEAVDDREALMYARYFDAETVAARRARRRILTNYEYRVQALVQNTSTFTGALTAAVAAKWNDPVNATPVDDIDKAKIAVRNNCGFLPNTLILTYNAYLNVRKCNQVLDRIKFSGRDDPKDVSVQVLEELFDIKNIFVAGAVTNTANENQAASINSIWNDAYATLCYVSDSPDIREVSLGRTFHYSEDGSSMGGAVETYRDERVRSSIVRVCMDTDEKLIQVLAGYLLTGVYA